MRLSLLAGAALGAASVAALKPVTAYGNKFFDSDGNQFFMRGIAYQLTEGELQACCNGPLAIHGLMTDSDPAPR